jgi:hypothetical protein
VKKPTQKKWKEFEVLAAWISQCLHERAVITPNDSVRDRDDQKPRNIDISIRVKDGPVQFFGIVEVRNRKTRVGKGYVEEISRKRESVNADAAFIVSSSGFWRSAINKAKALNIRLFSYQEAVSSDWNRCLRFDETKQYTPRYANPKITFVEESVNRVIDPSMDLVARVTADPQALVLEDATGEPKSSLIQLFFDVLNQNHERFFPPTRFGKPSTHDGVFVDLHSDPKLFFPGKDGQRHEIKRFFLEADFWFEEKTLPVRLAQYQRAETGEPLAEIASMTIQAWNTDVKLDFMAKFLGESGKEGTQILLRASKVGG